LSGLLLILAAELLSWSIRASDQIKEIRVLNKEIKLSQYSDDTTSFGKNRKSFGKLLELLDLLQDCSRLKLNQSKLEAMWLGKNANKTDTLFGVVATKAHLHFRDIILLQSKTLGTGKLFTKDMKNSKAL